MDKGNFIVGTYILLSSFQPILIQGENINLSKKEEYSYRICSISIAEPIVFHHVLYIGLLAL